MKGVGKVYTPKVMNHISTKPIRSSLFRIEISELSTCKIYLTNKRNHDKNYKQTPKVIAMSLPLYGKGSCRT